MAGFLLILINCTQLMQGAERRAIAFGDGEPPAGPRNFPSGNNTGYFLPKLH